MPSRSLPRTVRAVLAAAALLGATASAAAPAPREELNELRGRIQALQKELAESEEVRSEAADALRTSEKAISETNRRLAELGREQREADATLRQLRDQNNQVGRDIGAQHALLAKVLYRQYLAGQQTPLRLLLNGDDPNQAARDLHYYSFISRARARLIGDLRGSLKELDDLTVKAREKSAELAAIQAEQASQKQALEREKAERRAVLTKVSRQAEGQRREIGKLRRDEERLSKLVEKLGRIIGKKDPEPRTPGPRNSRLPDASADGNPFQNLKGKLALPVRGELANRFGSPRSDGGPAWKGLFIRADGGQEVRAVAAGRVVFADWLRGFGNLLIVDHGQGYMSLYGYNETLFRQVGDAIRGGDTVAAVGSTGGNPESGLYFEIRHQGKPVDPLGWVSLK